MILRQKPYNYKQCLSQHMHTHNVNAHTKYIHMDNTSTSTALLHYYIITVDPRLSGPSIIHTRWSCKKKIKKLHMQYHVQLHMCTMFHMAIYLEHQPKTTAVYNA